MGDININILDECSCYSREYVNICHGYGVESLLQLPTRNVTNSSTLIDHALTNLLHPPEAFIVRSNITDHFPIVLRFQRHNHASGPTYTKSIFDKDLYKELATRSDWSLVTSLNDAEASYNKLVDLIKDSISSSTTVVKCRKHFASPSNPWLTTGVLKSMRKKENLYRKCKNRPFNQSLMVRYKKFCTLLTHLLKEAKKTYYENLIVKTGHDSRKQWQIIRF